MAIAFDAVAIPSGVEYYATFSWTHTPVGTPKGVAVIIVQAEATDQVSGVTYGGVAMTRVRSDVRTTSEAGRVYIYFLGSSVPTGAQTVEVTLTGEEDTNAVSLTVTADADTAVDVSAGEDAGIIANPSLSISPTVEAVIFYGLFSGYPVLVTTVETGSTHIAGKDYGVRSAIWARKSVASGGATTIGYTISEEDVCHSALAIKEGAAGQTVTLAGVTAGVGTLTGAISCAKSLAGTASGVGTLTGNLVRTRTLAGTVAGVGTLMGDISIFVPIVPLAGVVSGTGLLAGNLTCHRSLIGVCAGQGGLAGALTIAGAVSYVELAGVGSGVGNLAGAISRGSYNPPFSASIHRVMCNLTFSTTGKRDQMKDDIDAWLVGKSLWVSDIEANVNTGENIFITFINANDMDTFFSFIEQEVVSIPAQSGSIRKHWCGHATGQLCQEIEESIV